MNLMFNCKRSNGSLRIWVLTALLVFCSSAYAQQSPNRLSACASWDTLHLEHAKLLVSNNTWGSDNLYQQGWMQCIEADRDGDGNARLPLGWRYNWLDKREGKRHTVKAYPEVIYGNKHGTDVSASPQLTGLPATLADLPEIQLRYHYVEKGSRDREINVAAESFFHTDCDIKGPGNSRGDNRSFEMMVWLQSGSEFPYPRPITMAAIAGELWDVYAKPEKSDSYIAFVAHQQRTQGTLHWNLFVEWLQRNGPLLGLASLQPQWCIGAVEFGTEIWHGQGEFTLQEYAVTVTSAQN